MSDMTASQLASFNADGEHYLNCDSCSWYRRVSSSADLCPWHRAIQRLAANLAAAGAMQVMFDAGELSGWSQVVGGGAWEPNVKGRAL